MGNMGQAILNGFVTSGTLSAKDIYISNRSPGKVEKMVKKHGCHGLSHGNAVIDQCDIVILATKPQDLIQLLESAQTSFREDQIVVSLAAGIQLAKLRKYISDAKIVRVMTNTPIFVSRGVIGFTMAESDIVIERIVKKLFTPLGYVVSLEEGDPFAAFTVGSASGTGFLLEMMSYWREWIQENGIDPEEASKIVIETFLGTAMLADQEKEQSFESLTQKVTSKKGVTAAGLQSFRELELEGLLRMSFNKALLRNQELGKSQ